MIISRDSVGSSTSLSVSSPWQDKEWRHDRSQGLASSVTLSLHTEFSLLSEQPPVMAQS